jgi:hypothetical protein
MRAIGAFARMFPRIHFPLHRLAGPCAHMSSAPAPPAPLPVADPATSPAAVAVPRTASGSAVAAVGAAHNVLSWGRGLFGSLGNGSYLHRPDPLPVADLAGIDAQHVACGWANSAAISRMRVL